MKSSRLLRRLAIVAATMLCFWATGVPTVSAADVTHDISTDNLTISASGSYIITCSSATGNTITIDSGITATVTLRGVSITAAASPINLAPGASVTLLLDGTNTLTSTGAAAIHVPSTATLTINEVSSGGSVTATVQNNNVYSAGIGSNSWESCGTVTVRGGTVTANGGNRGAGIGTGWNANGNSVTIYGGLVKAKGGSGGAGIGGGNVGDGGAVTIAGGSVEAQGGDLAAGIGGGTGGKGAVVTITGGTVTATGGTSGAGIGSGNAYYKDGSKVTISGGTVTATGGRFAAGIGGGSSGAGHEVSISGLNTSVTVKGEAGHDIGGGNNTNATQGGTLSVGDGSHLTLLTGIHLSLNPANVTLGNCTVDGAGAGSYKRTYMPPVPPAPPVSPSTPAAKASDSLKAEAPVFLRSTNGLGVEIDISSLALPAGVTLISNNFSGLPTQAAGKTWALSHKLAGTNGTFQGKDYLALYDFTLTDENGNPVTGYLGRVTVRLPLPSGSTGQLHVLYYDESGKQFTEVMAVPDNGYLTYSTTHFSSYLITGSGVTAEKPAIPETGAASFPFAAAGVVLVLTVAVFLKARNRLSSKPKS